MKFVIINIFTQTKKGERLKRIIPVTFLNIILLFFPFFSVSIQAQSYSNKIVVIENDPSSSGTYVDQGYTSHGYPVYKHSSKDLYFFVGVHSDYPDYLLWLFSDIVQDNIPSLTVMNKKKALNPDKNEGN